MTDTSWEPQDARYEEYEEVPFKLPVRDFNPWPCNHPDGKECTHCR